jgi:hypothetical protein
MTCRLVVTFVLAAVLAGAATAASGDPEKRALNARDQAWAQRINLTLRDLPSGFVQGPAQKTDWSAFTCPGFAPDLSAFTITGEAGSHALGNATTLLASASQVFRTAHDALSDWRLSARRGALDCFVRMLRQTESSTDLITSSKMRAAPRIGDRAISFRIAAMISANGRRARVWLDVVALTRGRARATLGIWGLRIPPSAGFERSLLAKLDRRLSP